MTMTRKLHSLLNRCCILICRCMQNHNNDTVKTSDTVLRKIYFSLYLKGLRVRGSWRPNRTATYWPPLLRPPAFLSRSPGLLNWRPGDPALCWVLFSLQHHFSISVISKLINRRPDGSLCWVLAFPTTPCLQLIGSPKLTDFLSSPSYIIVPRPLDISP